MYHARCWKITALKRILPDRLEEDVERQKGMTEYEEVKQYVLEQVHAKKEPCFEPPPGIGKTNRWEYKEVSAVEDGYQEEWGEEQQQEWEDALFQLMSKGKSGGKKGGGKGSFGRCYRCGGWGHSARDCPTPEGSTEQHQCYEGTWAKIMEKVEVKRAMERVPAKGGERVQRWKQRPTKPMLQLRRKSLEE